MQIASATKTRPFQRMNKANTSNQAVRSDSSRQGDSVSVGSSLKSDEGLTMSPVLKSIGAGVFAAGFASVPGLGLLSQVNAVAHSGGHAQERGGLAVEAIGLTGLVRIGGLAATLVTGNPAPYLAGIALNSATLGIDNALLTLREENLLNRA